MFENICKTLYYVGELVICDNTGWCGGVIWLAVEGDAGPVAGGDVAVKSVVADICAAGGEKGSLDAALLSRGEIEGEDFLWRGSFGGGPVESVCDV